MLRAAELLSALTLLFLIVIAVSVWSWLSSPPGRERWPWYLSECRYAEIGDRNIRQFAQRLAAETGLSGVCSQVYYDRGLAAEPHWKAAAEEYGFGLRISPDNRSLRVNHGMDSIASAEFRDAEADFTELLKLAPANSDYLTNRGQARELRGDWQGAIRDYSAAIRADPEVYGAYTYRGRAYALLGRYDLAIGDLAREFKLFPDMPTALWLYLAKRKAGHDDRTSLRDEVRSSDLKRWPGPAIRYFLGQISGAELERIARSDPNVHYFHQSCDAWFYLGEEALANGDRARARSYFQKTVSNCDAVDYERDAAVLELERLGG